MAGPILLPSPFPAGAGLPGSAIVTKTIPSFLYDEYSDDDDLQAFVASYNDLMQRFIDWFNAVGLPIYTAAEGGLVEGLLLDWVGLGLYGYPRPSLPTGRASTVGAYGTFFYGQSPIPYGGLRYTPPPAFVPTDDDIYRRALTWHFFKADGLYFSIKWLKRRVMRFLIGVNGIGPNVDQTYQISVTFGPNRQANVVIYEARRFLRGPGVYGRGRAYGMGPAYGTAPSRVTAYSIFDVAGTFKKLVDNGLLELPFQWSWTVTVVNPAS